MMKHILLFVAVILLTTCSLFSQESQDVKKKFSDAKVLTEDKTEEVRTQMRIPDTSAYMSRKRTDVSDNYRNFLTDKLKKSNQLLYK